LLPLPPTDDELLPEELPPPLELELLLEELLPSLELELPELQPDTSVPCKTEHVAFGTTLQAAPTWQ